MASATFSKRHYSLKVYLLGNGSHEYFSRSSHVKLTIDWDIFHALASSYENELLQYKDFHRCTQCCLHKENKRKANQKQSLPWNAIELHLNWNRSQSGRQCLSGGKQALEKVKQSRRHQTFICKNGAHADLNHVWMQLQANCNFVERIKVIVRRSVHFAISLEFDVVLISKRHLYFLGRDENDRLRIVNTVICGSINFVWPVACAYLILKLMMSFRLFSSSMAFRVADVSCIVTVSVHFPQRWRRFLLPINYYTSTVKYLWYEFSDTLFTNWMYSNGFECIYLKRDPCGRMYPYLISKPFCFFLCQIVQWFTKEC